ncbi:hypothetical protein NN561_019938 [Cricetulus griseus]
MTWPVGVSFAACGFLGVYHLGAAMALRAHGAGLLRDVTAFAGASAGALVAAALLTAPGSLEACTRFAHALAEDTRRQVLGPATPGFDFMERLRCTRVSAGRVGAAHTQRVPGTVSGVAVCAVGGLACTRVLTCVCTARACIGDHACAPCPPIHGLHTRSAHTGAPRAHATTGPYRVSPSAHACDRGLAHITLVLSGTRVCPVCTRVCARPLARRSGVDRILPANAHELARDRLHVSITNARTRENRLVSCFASRDDLIQVLLASSFIPVYMGLKPVEYAGQTWVDGGLTDSLPVLPAGRTVTVSPFCGRHDVSPRDPGWRGAYARVCNQDVAVSPGRGFLCARLAPDHALSPPLPVQVSPANLARLTRALFPPTRVTLESLFHDGFRDTVGFLRREGRFR